MGELCLTLSISFPCLDDSRDVSPRGNQVSCCAEIVLERADGNLLVIRAAILGLVGEQEAKVLALTNGSPKFRL